MVFEGRARYLVLAALSLLYFLLTATTFNSLGLVLPSMVTELKWNWAEAGFGFTLLGLACGLTGMVPAVMIRRIGVSMTVLAGALLLMAGFITLAATHSVLAYDVGTILLGLGFSICGTVPGVHVISHSFQRQSTAIGIYFSCGSLGSVAGPLLFYAVNAHADNWRTYWIIAAGIALALGLFAASVTSSKYATIYDAANAAPVDPNAWTARAALRTPAFYVIVAAYSVFLLVNTTIHSFAAQALQELGFSMGATASLLSMGAMIGAVGSTVGASWGKALAALSHHPLAGRPVGGGGGADAGPWRGADGDVCGGHGGGSGLLLCQHGHAAARFLRQGAQSGTLFADVHDFDHRRAGSGIGRDGPRPAGQFQRGVPHLHRTGPAAGAVGAGAAPSTPGGRGGGPHAGGEIRLNP
jgi:MFS family permease